MSSPRMHLCLWVALSTHANQPRGYWMCALEGKSCIPSDHV